MIAWSQAALAWQLNAYPLHYLVHYCKIVLSRLSKWHESGCTGLHTIVQYLDICVGHSHFFSDLYVARCRDGEVHIQCDLKLANVGLGS